MKSWKPLVATLFALALQTPGWSGTHSAAAPPKVFFYEHDTHFELTYVLMRLACFSHKEALIIASADQNVDDCGETDPGFNSSHNPKWHALDDSKEAVLKRKAELWARALGSKDLIQLGQYFHYQEDSWGHRQGHGIGEDWKPYGPTFGHAKDLAQPDRVPYDKERANAMAKEKLAQGQEFNRLLGHKQVDVPPDVVGYLIDAMCIPYTHDAFGLWNQVDPDEVGKALDNICQKFFAEGKIKKEIHVPPIKSRLRYEFDEDGHVTNKPVVDKILDEITDYNFPVTPEVPSKEVLKSEVATSFTVEETGQKVSGIVDWCYSNCNGGKHAAHAQCDASCDTPCSQKHGGQLKGYHELDVSQIMEAIPSLDWSTSNAGALTPAEEQIDAAVSKAIEPYDAQTFDLPTAHFSQPCSAAMRDYGYKKLKLHMHSVVTTTATVEENTKTETKTSDVVVATLYVPESTPIKTSSTVNCKCEATKTATMYPGPNHTPVPYDPAPGPQIVDSPDHHSIVLPKITFNGIDINELDVEMVEDGWEVYFPGGYTYFCDDPDCQGVVTMYGQRLRFIGGLSASLTGGSFSHGRIPVGCLDIGKKPPNPNVHYYMAPEQDPVLGRLSLITEWENQRGPWDQARLWIYRSHSTRDQVNARLVPGVTPGQYVKCLYEVAHDAKVAPAPELLEPLFVFDPFGSRAATLWFIETLSHSNPQGLAKAITDGAQAWGAKLQDNDRDYPHAVDIIDGLDQSLSPELHRVIPNVLAAIPEAARARILGKTILGKTRARLLSEPKKKGAA